MDYEKVAKYLSDVSDAVGDIRDANPLDKVVDAYISGLKSGFNLASVIVNDRDFENRDARITASNACFAGFLSYKLFSSIRRSFEEDGSAHD